MSDFPKFVEFREEGPREGFQIEKNIYPIEQRIELIDMLSETGLKRIQVGSFVSPKYVPQMADTGELFQRIKRKPGVKYTSLWLNDKGFRKALTAHEVDIDPRLLFYPSEAFAQANNNCSAAEMREKQREWVRTYKQEGYTVDAAYVMTAFGCNYEGPIPQERILDDFRFILQVCEEEDIPVPILVIADTMGWGNPEAVKRMIGALRELAPGARIGMHIHDTRGLGIANLYAALSIGGGHVRKLDRRAWRLSVRGPRPRTRRRQCLHRGCRVPVPRAWHRDGNRSGQADRGGRQGRRDHRRFAYGPGDAFRRAGQISQGELRRDQDDKGT